MAIRERTSAPIMWCGNKYDLEPHQVSNSIIVHTLNGDFKNQNISYCDVSAKSNYNCDQYLLKIGKALDPEFKFIETIY